MDSKPINPCKTCYGFTLIEVLVSVVILGIIATAITFPYISGLGSMDVQARRILMDSHLRSRMEVLVGTDFDLLSSGSEVVTINGENYTINWTVTPIDLDGDGNTETDAVQVTVSEPAATDQSLTTILVDNQGKTGKIS